MPGSILVITLIIMCMIAYSISYHRSLKIGESLGGIRQLQSIPFYYGMRAVIWCGLPSIALLLLWFIFDDYLINTLILADLPDNVRGDKTVAKNILLSKVRYLADGSLPWSTGDEIYVSVVERFKALQQLANYMEATVILVVAAIGLCWSALAITPTLKARQEVEKFYKGVLFSCAAIAILTTAGILFSVAFEALRFFQSVPIEEFLGGTQWSPQVAIRADQVGSSGSFGFIPLLTGTLLISFIAMAVAVPVGLLSAIYLSEYANAEVRGIVKPTLELLAGIPTVVYGFFAALTVAPRIREVCTVLGLEASSESALSAGLVMGIMIIPFVSSLTDDVIRAVPKSLREGSLGLGATQSETIKQVILPAALPGIVGGMLLAVSRAIGETMIVVMAAGLAANLTINPMESVTTITVQIVTLLVGDQEFDSPKTLAAFALGLALFLITLLLNVIALKVVRKYQEQYD